MKFTQNFTQGDTQKVKHIYASHGSSSQIVF